jgi:glycosyltransferase involved in cell wall biosynthesis
MLVENATVPGDRRVWMEALTLRNAGYGVSVISPQKYWPKRYEELEGVSIYRFPCPSMPGLAGHLVEYAIALTMTFALAWVVYFREGFHFIHAANPPDFFYLIGRCFKLLGKKFIFDHHDLVPESCLIRWSGLALRVTYAIAASTERATFRTADVVITTNQSYRRVAIERGHVDPERIFVVRSAIRKSDFRDGCERPELRRGRRYLVCFIGTIGPSDGLDQLMMAFRHIVFDRQRKDIQLALLGGGDVLTHIERLRDRVGLAEHVVFTGHLSDNRLIADYLATSDVCVEPAPKNPFNDRCTMNKVVEYMAMGKPVVAFDLTEVRDTARGAGVYVQSNDPVEFGDQIVRLLDSPDERLSMGGEGVRRFNEVLAWEYQRDILLGAYAHLQDEAVALSA